MTIATTAGMRCTGTNYETTLFVNIITKHRCHSRGGQGGPWPPPPPPPPPTFFTLRVGVVRYYYIIKASCGHAHAGMFMCASSLAHADRNRTIEPAEKNRAAKSPAVLRTVYHGCQLQQC